MNFLETVRVAWEALVANKMRSLLTMLGIIIGVGAVVAIFAIGRGAGDAITGELAGLGTGQILMHPGSLSPDAVNERLEPFREQDLEDLETLIPGIEVAAYDISTMGTIKYGRESITAYVQGHLSRAGEAFNIEIDRGRWFSEVEEQAGSRVVVLGSGAVDQLMGEGADAVGEEVTINGTTFSVIGVTKKPTGMLASMSGAGDSVAYVPIGYMKRLYPERDITMIYLKAKDGEDPQMILEEAIALVEQRHSGASYSGETFDQFVGIVDTVLSIITGVLSAVAGISLVVGGVGIMNIMLVSVTERTREIGIRKAIGATYRDVMSQFLIEAVLLSLTGGLIGVLLAAVPVILVGKALNIAMGLDVMSVGLALGFSAAVGILFGVYPASKAARLDPIEALRYE